jgi:hypothetical protein
MSYGSATSKRSVGSILKDHLKDLVRLMLPFAALLVPVAGAFAYMDGLVGWLPAAASIVAMCVILRVMRDPGDSLIAEGRTLLSPFVFLAMVGHFILLCFCGVVAACWLLIILLGAGQGDMAVADAALAVVFFVGNASYVFSFMDD